MPVVSYALAAYREELTTLAELAGERGEKLNFFRGTWGVREVAAFLGLDYETVRHRRAGLNRIPVVRYPSGGKGKRHPLRFLPRDIIAFRENHYKEGVTSITARRIANLG